MLDGIGKTSAVPVTGTISDDATVALAMARAVELAWGGWGRVSPNPMVGAVIVLAEAIVGDGFHREFGQPHAEVEALVATGERSRGATLVVTLEPCRHRGKQPPCVPVILEAGIRRVVAALADPNPAAAGGAEELRRHGVEVVMGVGARDAAQQNAIFLHRYSASNRPYVALKLATSIDARLADYRHRSRWLSGPEAREYVHWLRAGFDAIGVGGRTARSDDPVLTVRGSVTPRVPPARVVFSESAELPVGAALRSAGGPPTFVVGGSRAAPETADSLMRDGLRFLPAADLGGALAALRDAGIASILIEGGGRLAARLIEEDLVDRFYWIQTPLWLGEEGVPAFAGLAPRPLEEAHRWDLVERHVLGGDFLTVLDREPCSRV